MHEHKYQLIGATQIYKDYDIKTVHIFWCHICGALLYQTTDKTVDIEKCPGAKG